MSKKKQKVEIAAGGLVKKGKKYLFIFRLGKWDLPKGKLEKKESIEACAIREVEEECGVKAKIISKLAETEHEYAKKSKNVIKKVFWFEMECLDDKKMKPQKEEDIEKVQWFRKSEIKEILSNTYPNIKKIVRSAVLS